MYDKVNPTVNIVANDDTEMGVNIGTASEGLEDLEADYATQKEEATLDAILVRIGQFGRFQLIVFLLICVPMLFNAVFSVTYIFTSSTVVQRCNITECDSPTSTYREPWTEYSIPMKGRELDQCHRFANKYENETFTMSPLAAEEGFCYAENFNQDEKMKCPDNNFIFRDKEVTISNEFGIYCADEWKLTLVGTMNNVGQFFGIPIGGFISDRYGRRTALTICGFVSAFLGIIRSFSPNYLFFLAFEFLDNMASSPLYSTCFIVGIELVGPKRRVIACSIITIFYAIGEILLALVSKYYQNWRTMLRIVYVPALILVVYFWVLPESVRWLLSQSREEDAKAILKRAARVNKRKLSDPSLDKLILANREKLNSTTDGRFPIKEVFRKFHWRIANCAFCWIVNVLVYYGISLNTVLLDGNKYNNFIYIAMVEIPGFLIPYVIMDRFGRRYSLFGAMLICGASCLTTTFLKSDQHALQLTLFLIGKMMITTAFQVLYFFTSEIFPTSVRNSLLSFCSMMGRFGSMLAPQTPLLAKHNESAPAILFAVCATVSGCLALFFPETTNIVLPATMNDAHNIGASEKNKNRSATVRNTNVEL